jgi:hypothetical protein
VAGGASASSAGGASHPAAAHTSGSAHVDSATAAAARDGATARSIIGESASGFVVTKQTLSGRSVSITSFKTPRPLTGPERRRLNHDGFVATKSNDEVYYCRQSLVAIREMDCFGPESR